MHRRQAAPSVSRVDGDDLHPQPVRLPGRHQQQRGAAGQRVVVARWDLRPGRERRTQRRDQPVERQRRGDAGPVDHAHQMTFRSSKGRPAPTRVTDSADRSSVR